MLKLKVDTPADLDPQETSEWLEALDQIIDQAGPDRARFLLSALTRKAAVSGVEPPTATHTPYVNTIAPEDELPYPGDLHLEDRLRALVRWNALAMVVRANKYDAGIGGHIATFASQATLIEVGQNHFYRASINGQPGDLFYFQGHASPGQYSRAFLEGRALLGLQSDSLGFQQIHRRLQLLLEGRHGLLLLLPPITAVQNTVP